METVAGVEVRMTTGNHIFCFYRGIVAFPTLRGSSVLAFDNRVFMDRCPAAAKARLLEILRKQQRIRRQYWRRDDDPASFYDYEQH